MTSVPEPSDKRPSPLSCEESRAKRLANLLTTCLDVSIGAIWWVNESLLKSRLSHYDQNSTREGHPCVSVRTHPAQSLFERVPMLFGSSGDRGPVVARGLTRNAPNYPTSFGQIVAPAPLQVWEFVVRMGRTETSLDEETEYRGWLVRANAWKPRFNEEELAALQSWIASHTQRRR